MKIAQVAPLYERVPPKYYGGTERVVSYLTEELVRQGHEVTLFASGDSVTSARLCAPCPRALRLDETCVDSLVHHLLLIEAVFQQAPRFDLVHFHTDYLHFPLSRRQRLVNMTTLHGRLCLQEFFYSCPVATKESALHDGRTKSPFVHSSSSSSRSCRSSLHQMRERI